MRVMPPTVRGLMPLRELAHSAGRLSLDGKVVVGVFIAVGVAPLGISTEAGRITGWLTLVLAFMAIIAILRHPIDRRSLVLVAPYLGFMTMAIISVAFTDSDSRGMLTLLQFSITLLIYMVAVRAFGRDGWSLARLATSIALLVSPLFVVVIVRSGTDSLFAIVGSEARPAAMAATAALVWMSLGQTRRFAIFASIGVAAFIAATGARTAFVVAFLTIAFLPALRIRIASRIIIVVAGVVLALIGLSTPLVSDRMFYGRQGSIENILELNFNTAGRFDIWQSLGPSCAQSQPFGAGVGSTYSAVTDITGGRLLQPHNEYLRTYCEVGILGASMLWLFYGWAAWRSIRLLRRRESDVGWSALLLLGGLFAFSITDNPLVYVIWYTLPVIVMVALVDAIDAPERHVT